MKKTNLAVIAGASLFSAFFFMQTGCNQPATDTTTAATVPEKAAPTHAEMVSRGKYIITIAGCGDCHTPKNMTPQGPVDDTTRALSGHPEKMPVAPFDKNLLKPGPWVALESDLTAFVGPWGISFPANLTPDSTTGIGAWTEDVFIKTLRTGKHLGQDGGRPILPPMPWYRINQATDEDLKAVFTYLQSLPPIKNKVPAPINPMDAVKLK